MTVYTAISVSTTLHTHRGPAHKGSRAPRTRVHPGALESSDFTGKKLQNQKLLLLRLTSADISRSPSRGSHGERPSVSLSAPPPGVNTQGVWGGAGSSLLGGRDAQ